MRRILFLAMLLLGGTAAAQGLPERSQVRKGNRQYDKGNYERAIERYTRALEAAPGSFEATYDLGNALCKAERFETAEQTLARAAADSLRGDAERAEAFYNLGNAQFHQKKYREALESYRSSLLLNPADMEAKYNYAYTKRLLEDDENGGGGGGNDEQQQEQSDDGEQPQQPQGGDGERQQPQPQQPDGSDPQDPRDDPSDNARPQPAENTLSEQEQQQLLDAIQAQEDRTQEKLKERQGVVVRGKKNW